MKSIPHVCPGGTAAELVKAAVGGRVIDIMDDCAVGPLVDVDSSSPDARIAFWRDFYSLDEEMSAMMDWGAEFRAIRNKLMRLARGVEEIVIWAGSHPTEQMVRRRIHWWLKDAPLAVTEVIVDVEDMVPDWDYIHAPIAGVSIDRLRSRFARRSLSTADDRKQLAAEWAALRENGRGVRIWEGGRLSERPIDHYDAGLLSVVGTEPVIFARALGQTMFETGRSDMFCTWRFAALILAGRISLHGNLHDRYAARVSRSVNRDVQ